MFSLNAINVNLNIYMKVTGYRELLCDDKLGKFVKCHYRVCSFVGERTHAINLR